MHSIMCIIKKVFYYEETELSVIKCKDGICFRGKTIAEILKYANQGKAIRDHVDPEDRARGTNRSPLKRTPESKWNEMFPLTNNEKNTIDMNQSGLYSLILCSKLECARVFKQWVTKDVLPSIRKTGRYIYDGDINHNITKNDLILNSTPENRL